MHSPIDNVEARNWKHKLRVAGQVADVAVQWHAFLCSASLIADQKKLIHRWKLLEQRATPGEERRGTENVFLSRTSLSHKLNMKKVLEPLPAQHQPGLRYEQENHQNDWNTGPDVAVHSNALCLVSHTSLIQDQRSL
jgi:hypothetical protein